MSASVIIRRQLKAMEADIALVDELRGHAKTEGGRMSAALVIMS